jgi:hypothetical protein
VTTTFPPSSILPKKPLSKLKKHPNMKVLTWWGIKDSQKIILSLKEIGWTLCEDPKKKTLANHKFIRSNLKYQSFSEQIFEDEFTLNLKTVIILFQCKKIPLPKVFKLWNGLIVFLRTEWKIKIIKFGHSIQFRKNKFSFRLTTNQLFEISQSWVWNRGNFSKKNLISVTLL